MEIRKIVIGFVLFSMVVLTFTLVFGELKDNFGLTSSTGATNTSYNQITNLQDIATNMSTEIMDKKNTEDDAVSSIARGSYGALRLTSKTVPIFQTILDSVFMELHMADKWAFIKYAIFTIFLLIITFGIINTVMLRRTL